eukprot:m.183708 g.183708  ORF g.183708 m.183708 type:complete len:215 (+) comp18484_c0_seq2:224-868(+)
MSFGAHNVSPAKDQTGTIAWKPDGSISHSRSNVEQDFELLNIGKQGLESRGIQSTTKTALAQQYNHFGSQQAATVMPSMTSMSQGMNGGCEISRLQSGISKFHVHEKRSVSVETDAIVQNIQRLAVSGSSVVAPGSFSGILREEAVRKLTDQVQSIHFSQSYLDRDRSFRYADTEYAVQQSCREEYDDELAFLLQNNSIEETRDSNDCDMPYVS